MRGKSARDLTEAEVREIAVGYLCRREYGIEELRKKLIHRGVDSDLAETVVSDLVEKDLLSDQRFTEMYVRTRLRSLYGPMKIRGELRSRGISDYLIAEALPKEQDVWFDMATEWVTRRNPGELDYAGRVKIYRSLMNRGFTHEQANVALDNLNTSD